MVGMSYQMPTGIGIIKGGGDVKIYDVSESDLNLGNRDAAFIF